LSATKRLKLYPMFEGDPVADESYSESATPTQPLSVLRSTSYDPDTIAASECAGVPAPPKPLSGSVAAQLDRELDLMDELKSLNKQRDANKETMQALLYELHDLMAGAGREGKFTPFLREGLGWTDKYAYNKATRWIAAHMYRVGLIDEVTYNKRMGNGSRALRGASEDEDVPNTSAPILVQTFITEADPLAPPLSQPAFSPEEIDADANALEQRRAGFFKTVLIRAMYPLAFADWFHLGLRIQAERHGTKTMAETLAAIVFLGTKPANPNDVFDELMDEFLHDIGHDPTWVLRADWIHPDDRCETDNDQSLKVFPDPAKFAGYVAGGTEKIGDPSETTLDDFDGPPCW
jgi:hypothetical protein